MSLEGDEGEAFARHGAGDEGEALGEFDHDESDETSCVWSLMRSEGGPLPDPDDQIIF